MILKRQIRDSSFNPVATNVGTIGKALDFIIVWLSEIGVPYDYIAVFPGERTTLAVYLSDHRLYVFDLT